MTPIFLIEKNADLVHEVAPDVRLSHEVAEHEIPVTKLPRVSVLVSLHTWQSVFLQIPPEVFIFYNPVPKNSKK